MTWYEELASLRKSKGWSIRKLGEVTGMNISNLSRIERGEVIPSIETYKKITEAMDAEVQIIRKEGK